jgi:hypothetical protein
MTSRKYTPPLKIKPEPTTRKAILDEIDDLEAQLPQSESRLRDWIEKRIKELRERLKCLKTQE